MKFHHIGIACRNIEEELKGISEIHDVFHVGPVVYDSEQKASLCMLQTSEGIQLELIAGEQVAGILKKGISYYHLPKSVRLI
jgi:methylmalonyl-CoA/ethylmalonyl-CoA epimerase